MARAIMKRRCAASVAAKCSGPIANAAGQCQMNAMNFLSDPITLAALVISALAGFKLWQILGRNEARPLPPPPQPDNSLRPSPTDLELKAAELPPRVIWQGFAPEQSPLALGLQSIADRNPEFDTARFMQNAGAAYETILNAFANGEINRLEPLLSKSTLDVFAKEIQRRKQAGEVCVFKFVRLIDSDLQKAEIIGNAARLTVAFKAELVSAIKKATGALMSGDEKSIVHVKEIWIFACRLDQDPMRWQLAETHDAI
jgi:predicted lipid-binding transport protein (Tim44 family)